MNLLDESAVIMLAKRNDSFMDYSWTEYLTISKGLTKRFLIATAEYQALAEASIYFNRATETYNLPEAISGQKVVGVENGYVIGGNLWIDSDDTGYAFDDLGDPEITNWLARTGWDLLVTINIIKIALIDPIHRINL